MKRYSIKQDVHGAFGTHEFAYEAGDVTAKDEAEQKVLDKLVALGIARVQQKKE